MIYIYGLLFILFMEIERFIFIFNNKKIYVELASKIVSLFHSLWISYYSVLFLLDSINEELYISKFYITYSYLIYDMVLITYYYKYFINDYIFTFVHHFSFLIGLYYTLNYKLAAQCLLAEITNPFLYLGWLLVKINKNTTLIFKLNGISLYILFFIFRFCNLTYLNYIAFFSNNNNILLIEKISVLFLYILNANWFRLLTFKFINLFKNVNKINDKLN